MRNVSDKSHTENHNKYFTFINFYLNHVMLR